MRLGLGQKKESVIVEVPVELVRAAEMSGDVEIDAMVENAIANVIRDR
jgi:5,10-methylene-tetrahydrofolate dehydrogenase/methenyl tetrahydrofolate cyclohydrolase